MPSLGDRLREERVKQGRDIAGIASDIRVNQSYLEAIEESRLDKLPGGFFTRSFIRQYAETLGIPLSSIESDMDSWLRREDEESQPNLEPKTMKTGLAPVVHVIDGGRKPRRRVFGALAGLVVVVGACAGLYSLWMKQQNVEPPPIFPDEPLQTAAAADPPAETQQTPPPEAPELPADETDQEGVAGEPVVITPPPDSTGGESIEGALWFEIRATEETWVRVKAGDRTLFVGILDDGEARRFTGLSMATMRVGNAGGLLLSASGRSAEAVGPRGQIRIVTLTPSRVSIEAPQSAPRSSGAGSDQSESIG